jgi:hypothetical protein
MSGAAKTQAPGKDAANPHDYPCQRVLNQDRTGFRERPISHFSEGTFLFYYGQPEQEQRV